jgi:tRNA(Ile)-lysidine synthase
MWREDSSNASDDYARNLLRHQVVPHMETLNPNFIHTAARNMRRIRAANENLSYFLNALVEADHSKLSIDKQAITRLPSPRQAIRQLLKPYGFDAEQTRQISLNLDHIGLEIRSETGYTALIDRHKILVSFPTEQPGAQPKIVVQEDDLMLRLPDGSQLFLMPGRASADEAVPTLNINSVAVDAEKLQFPLHLRHWQPGDYFQPLGMEGKRQKLQDFFTNQKLSRFEKDAVWLLVNGDDAVIWVIGHRLDERFKIQPSTRKLLKINLVI